MKDLLLDASGDLLFVDGDVVITDSVIQAIKIRLKWFVGEWKINPEWGVSYYEDVFVKTPNKLLIEEMLREEILSVSEVTEVKSVSIDINKDTRCATITFTAMVGEQTLHEEVLINV